MRQVEDFMQEYFKAKIADEEEHQARRAPFRAKFFDKDCHYDSHAGTLDMRKSERIVEVERDDTSPKVITEQVFQFNSGELKIHKLRHRYHLSLSNGDWQIQNVQMECVACRYIKTNKDCHICHGTGWRD